MKTNYIIIILCIIVTISIVSTIVVLSDTLQEHYEIEIVDLKESYEVGEPYYFSYIVSGYGDICGGWKITTPNNKSVAQGMGSISLCGDKKLEKIYNDLRNDGIIYGPYVLDTPGDYEVSVEFYKDKLIAKTTKSFTIVAKEHEN
jgi:hypothetical protein